MSLQSIVSLREKGVDLNKAFLGGMKVKAVVSLREKGVDLNDLPVLSLIVLTSPFVRREWI